MRSQKFLFKLWCSNKKTNPFGNLKVHTEYETPPMWYWNDQSAGINEMKKIKCKICNQRKNIPTTPNTKATYAQILADIVNESKPTTVAEMIKPRMRKRMEIPMIHWLTWSNWKRM